MKASIRSHLEQVADRFEEVTALLADPDIQGDPDRFRDLSREYAQIEPLATTFDRFRLVESEATAAEEMLADPEMEELAREELEASRERLAALEPELQRMLIPPDPDDHRSVFVEVRAGTGGAEAALFAGDLLRAYLRYAEARRWQESTSRAASMEEQAISQRLAAEEAENRRLPQVRVGNPPGAAGAGNRIPGPGPHIGVHRGHTSRARGNRARGHQFR